MSIAVNIFSVVLKSVIDNRIENEFAKELIGIPIDGISDKSINMINDYINSEKSKIKYIFSKEKMESMNISKENVDYVITEIKYLLSEVRITDEVFRQCKYDSMELSNYLLDEYRVYKGIYIECENDIKKMLFSIANVLIRLMRDSEEIEKNLLIQISNSVDDTNAEVQKIYNYMQDNFNNLDANNQTIVIILHSILSQIQNTNIQNKEQSIKSRTQEYLNKWNDNMFLNNFNKRDKNAGINIKLKDVYLEAHLPHYIWVNNWDDAPLTDLKSLLFEHVKESIDNQMLLILGQPGIGKSSLITWITANFTSIFDDIMIYQFAADLKNVDWQKSCISTEILDALNLSYNDLHGKILILDGFDEVSVRANRRDILDQLYGDWIYRKTINNFKLIITCRENYIRGFERVKCRYITLQPWDEKQIQSFCVIFQEKTKCDISEHTVERVIENKQILGIPLILYMVLALNITIEGEGSIVDIYDKIFSLEGGIYDRCIENKYFADFHRIGEVKRQIHQISREIAIWMFENNPNEACIPREEYEKICDSVMNEYIQNNEGIKQDILIGNYFKLIKHCEGIGTEELYFVHRSIYEYFVAETIYSSIENAIISLTDESQEELAKNIAIYLKRGEITYTIGKYLQFKILKLYQNLNNEKKKRFYIWWEETFEMMMINGMFYFSEIKIQSYKNIIYKETNCFVNFVKILRLLLMASERKYIMKDTKIKYVEKYIKFLNIYKNETFEENVLNFSKMWLCGINLVGCDFTYADFRGANLQSADLSVVNLQSADLREINLIRAKLRNADLRNAKIRKADLRKTDLRSVDLRNANLRETNLCGANLQHADLRHAYLQASIWYDSDIRKALSQLKEANFNMLLIRDGDGVKQVNRNELFPDEIIHKKG